MIAEAKSPGPQLKWHATAEAQEFRAQDPRAKAHYLRNEAERQDEGPSKALCFSQLWDYQS